MPQLLGKRKERPVGTAPAPEDAEAIFRRHFEAQFRPLEAASSRTKAAPAEEDNEEDETDSDLRSSEWDGFSEEDDSDHTGSDSDDGVEVIDYASTNPDVSSSYMTKREMKAYMSSRPPPDSATSEESGQKTRGREVGDDDQDEDSKTLLANDLALQRLISESKILSQHASFGDSPFSSTMGTTSATKDTAPTAAGGGGSKTRTRGFQGGRLRRATTEMRLQALGGRGSVLGQERMPMAMRRGIEGAAAQREARRRREAKENGIVLEREAGGRGKNAKANNKKRSRSGGAGPAVDMPGVGKMRGAELRLSGKDIRSIEGPRTSGVATKKRGKRR